MYLSSPTKIWEAGTGGTGVTAPANRWFFGEGATGSFFDAWILLSNPGSTDATVDVRYVADSGADVTRTHTVPAGRRITIRVVDEDPAMMNTSFATFVTSTNAVPVVAERAMWWRSNEGHWTAGHVGVGFTEGGKKWVTADGVAAADGSSDTYALVSNTENRAGMLKVTAVFGDGTAPVERLFAIGAEPALHHPRPAALPGGRRQGLQLHHRVDRRLAGRHRRRPLDLLRHGRPLLGDGHDVAGFEDQ